MTLLYNGVGTSYRKMHTIFIDSNKDLLLVSWYSGYMYGCGDCVFAKGFHIHRECKRKEAHGTCHSGSRPDKSPIIFLRVRTMNKSEEVAYVI